MGMKEFTLPSGAALAVSTSPFADAHALLRALLAAGKGVRLSQKDPFKEDISILKDAFIEAATSPEVDAAIFKCLARASYDGIKVTKDIFDDPKLGDRAREDFFMMAWHAIEVNCAPFFGQAFSSLKERLKTPTASPKSTSTATRP